MSRLTIDPRRFWIPTAVVVLASGWLAAPANAVTLPTSPTAVAVAQPAVGSATVSWSPPASVGSSPVSGYGVSRNGVDSAGHGAYSTTVAATARSFTMTKLVTGDTYKLAVWAITAAGTGPAASVNVTILPTPSEVVVIQTGASSAAIQWQPPDGVSAITGYRVARNGKDSSGAGAYSTTVAPTTTSFTMTKLVPGSAYTLSVQVLTSAGAGPTASGVVSIFPAWTARTMPDPSGSTASARNGLACVSMTWCVAVGSYDNSSSVQLPLAQRWNGSAWATLPVAAPTGAATSELNSVACPSVTLCMAVGDYDKTATGSAYPFAARWNGSTWTVTTLPSPAGASTIPAGVSCPTTSFCLAVGTAWSAGLPYAVRWNGSTWSSMPPKSAADSSGFTRLVAVSCASTVRCEAVGNSEYDENSQGISNVIEGWNGTTWALQSVGGDGGDLYLSYLTSVSCPTVTSCTAVGYSYDGDDFYSAADEYTWNGKSWAYVATPDPTGGVEDANDPALSVVSCVSATVCTAVGYTGPFGGISYVVNQAAGGFSLETTPLLPSAISCPTAGHCIAVGQGDQYAVIETIG